MLGEVEISVTNFCYRPKTTDRLLDKIHKGEDFPLSDACARALAATLASSATSTCTVGLSQPAAIGGATVALASNNGELSVPASVTVVANSTSASFMATAATSAAL